MNLCPLCKKEHSLNHNVIIYGNILYICEEHGESYISYCNQCKKNLCFACEEKHNNHNITDFKSLRKNKIYLEKELNKYKEYIDISKNIVDKEIKNYIEKWNKVINNYEIIYQIKKDIFSTMNQSLRNLQKLINQELIIKQFEKDFLSIINAKNINERYNNILEIYLRMEKKINLFPGDKKK